MTKVYNFSAGPATLPEEVLDIAQKELKDYQNSGISVMEMSHRSSSYIEIHQEAADLLKDLMKMPENYKVLFLGGGASTQFAMVPLNLMTDSKQADYVVTGSWSKKALDEAKRFGDATGNISSEADDFTTIPDLKSAKFRDNLDYIHITTNNTIYGTVIAPEDLPETKDTPLVADMSSNILSQAYPTEDFGLIYAGAQKNLGIAGVTIVILNPDILKEPLEFTPKMLNYKTHIEKDSMFNTPPTYPIYISKLVFQWIKEQGGAEAMEARNREKAALLYDYLDESKLFKPVVDKNYRSLMNVTFVTGDKDLDAKCAKEAEANGLLNIKGHRSVGGMRASIYNAMPIEGVKTLVNFLKDFETDNK